MAVEFPRAARMLCVFLKCETPSSVELEGVSVWEPGDDLLSHTGCAISSARFRFTVLFGKGRGGSEMLWSPSVTCPFGGVEPSNVKR